MSLEPQSGAPTGPPVENPTTIISPAERSLMDLWRVLMKRRLTIAAVSLIWWELPEALPSSGWQDCSLFSPRSPLGARLPPRRPGFRRTPSPRTFCRENAPAGCYQVGS